jgi:hypothetical protein
MLTRNMRYRVFDAALFMGCSVGALYAAQRAVAAAPVEEAGWEGAKAILTQIQEDIEPPTSQVAHTICYRPTVLHTEVGPVAALALYLGFAETGVFWQVENAVGVTVADALAALGEGSALSAFAIEDIKACPSVESRAPLAPDL